MDIPDWWAPNGHVQFVNVKIQSAFDGPRFRFKIGKADIHRKAGWPDGNTLRFSCFMDPDFLSTLLNVDDRMERRKWRDWRRQGKGLADVSSSNTRTVQAGGFGSDNKLWEHLSRQLPIRSTTDEQQPFSLPSPFLPLEVDLKTCI